MIIHTIHVRAQNFKKKKDEQVVSMWLSGCVREEKKRALRCRRRIGKMEKWWRGRKERRKR